MSFRKLYEAGRLRNIVPAATLVLILTANALADSLVVPWAQVAPLVTTRKVRATLTDGTEIEGRVSSATTQNLSIDVHRSSNRSMHAIGLQTISHEQIASLKVNRSTKRWRIIGAAVGAAAGFPLGVVGGVEADGLGSKGSGNGVFALIIGGMAGAGFLIGWV